MPSLKDLVARNLRALREKHRYSQQEVALRAGVSVSYISMLERGERSPPLETLAVLAKALNTTAVKLLQ